MNSQSHQGRGPRGSLAPIALLLSSALVAVPCIATAQQVASTAAIAIEAQPLENALIELAKQSGVGIFAPAELVQKIQVQQPVRGTMSMEDALRQLLDGTGLTFQRNAEGGYVVMPPRGADAGADPALTLAQAGETAIDPALTDPGKATELTTQDVTSQKRGGIEEIIVTARKREESVQDVPISITALTAENMKDMGIRNIRDFEGVVPGINMGGGGNGLKGDSNPYIRGVGQRETKVTLDPAVATYIDGIYIARTSGALMDSTNIQRIEVLRGPQGTLFGRNTTGGAISVTTKKPQNSFSGEINSVVGNYGRRDISGSVDIPLIDGTLLSRLTGASIYNEGYFTNVEDGVKWGDDGRVSGMLQLRWLPTESLLFDLLGEHTKIRQHPRPQRCQFVREAGFATGQVGFFNQYAAFNNGPNVARFEDLCRASGALPNDTFTSDFTNASVIPVGNTYLGSGASDPTRGEILYSASPLPEGRYWVNTSTVGLTGTWSIGDLGPVSGLELKSISAYRRTEQIADEDLDGIGQAALMRIAPDFNETDQYSQELQLTGSAFEKRLFFSTGLYGFKEKTPRDELILSASMIQRFNRFSTNTGPLPPGDTRRVYTVLQEPNLENNQTDNQAWAWFGQVDFNVLPELQLTAGLRYTDEERYTRYTKTILDLTSVVNGPFPSTRSLQYPQIGLAFGSHATSGFNRFDTWRAATVCDGGSFAAVPIPCSGVEEARVHNTAWTPMFSAKYHAQDELLDALHLSNAMAYFTYSQGFSSGGVNQGAVDDPADADFAAEMVPFKPSSVKNYELGLKLTGWDRRVQANLAAYYMDYKDMQLTSVASKFGIPIPFIENIGKSIITGVEVEFLFLPTPQWTVMLNGSYTDASIKEWESRRVAVDLFGAPIAGGDTVVDRSDEPMPRVPRVQAFALTSYSFLLPANQMVTPSISARYVSEIYHGFDRGSFDYGRDVVTSKAETFLDGRLSWISGDGNLEVALWGRNLTNIDDYLVGGIPLTDVNGAVGIIYQNPRTYGLDVLYRFGS